VILADDGIKFPITSAGAVIDNRWPFINADTVNELATAVIAAIAFAALFLTT